MMAMPVPVMEVAPVVVTKVPVPVVVTEVAVPAVPVAAMASAAADLLDHRSSVRGVRGLGARQGRGGGLLGYECRASNYGGADGERFEPHISSSSRGCPGGVSCTVQ